MDGHAPREIVLDLRRTEFLGSAGVAVLLRLRRRALARGCGTAPRRAQRLCRSTLHGLGLSSCSPQPTTSYGQL